jgi:hypothetical protein
MKYGKYASLKQVYEVSHHTDEEFRKNVRFVIYYNNFCYGLHYIYKAYRKTSWLLRRPLCLPTDVFIKTHSHIKNVSCGFGYVIDTIRVAFQNRNQNKNINQVITIHTANKPLFVSKLYP